MLPPRPIDPERIVNQALDLRDAGRDAEALATVRAGLARFPRHARLHRVAGTIHRAQEQSAEAVAAFAAAQRIAPTDLSAAHSLAQASLEAGYPAVALFDRARRLAPADGSLLLGRAAAQLAEGQGAQAIADLDAVLANSPTWFEGHRTLARLRWQLGDDRPPDASWRRAIARHPGDAQLRIELIDFLCQIEDWPAAAAAIAAARTATATDLDAFEAVVASEQGEVEQADRLFARFTAVPNVAMAVRHMRHLLRTGRAAAAAARAEPLLGDPAADELWPYLATAWRLLGDPRWAWLEGDAALIGVQHLSLDLAPLADRLRALHRTVAHPVGQSVRGGTQTDGPLFARAEPELVALRRAVVAAVERHVAQLPPADPAHPLLRHRKAAPVHFAGSWSVRLNGGSGHHTHHVHPQGWLSSALYVALPADADRGPAPAGHLLLGQPPAELALDLPPIRTVEPQPGRLVLFPSTLWHGTAPFGAGERLSVAFDVARPR